MRFGAVIGRQVHRQRRDAVGIADRCGQVGQPSFVATGTPKTAMPDLGEFDGRSEADSAAGPGDDRYLHVSSPIVWSVARI